MLNLEMKGKKQTFILTTGYWLMANGTEIMPFMTMYLLKLIMLFIPTLTSDYRIFD